MQTVLSMGVTADRIVYANPCKQSSYIKFASKVGVDLMTFDNVNELRKIKTVFPNARLVPFHYYSDTHKLFSFSHITCLFTNPAKKGSVFF